MCGTSISRLLRGTCECLPLHWSLSPASLSAFGEGNRCNDRDLTGSVVRGDSAWQLRNGGLPVLMLQPQEPNLNIKCLEHKWYNRVVEIWECLWHSHGLQQNLEYFYYQKIFANIILCARTQANNLLLVRSVLNRRHFSCWNEYKKRLIFQYTCICCGADAYFALYLNTKIQAIR